MNLMRGIRALIKEKTLVDLYSISNRLYTMWD